jgi:hypothetical protein
MREHHAHVLEGHFSLLPQATVGYFPITDSRSVRKKQTEINSTGTKANLAIKLLPGRLVIGPTKCLK